MSAAIFRLLDRNGDGNLDESDLEHMDRGERLDRWTGRLRDRREDMRELAADQWLDSMAEYPPAVVDAGEVVAK